MANRELRPVIKKIWKRTKPKLLDEVLPLAEGQYSFVLSVKSISYQVSRKSREEGRLNIMLA